VQQYLLASKDLPSIAFDDHCSLNAGSTQRDREADLWLSTDFTKDSDLIGGVTGLVTFALRIKPDT
jgi:hypothetical protein